MRKRVVITIMKDGKQIGELFDGELSLADGYEVGIKTVPDPDDSWKRLRVNFEQKNKRDDIEKINEALGRLLR